MEPRTAENCRHSCTVKPKATTVSSASAEINDETDSAFPLLDAADEEERNFGRDLADAHCVTTPATTCGTPPVAEAAGTASVYSASTPEADDFFEGGLDIPDEMSPGERVSARATPPGGSPTDCCGARTEEMIFGRLAALHAKERELSLNLSPLQGGTTEPDPQPLVKEVKFAHDVLKPPKVILPPDWLPFVAPDLCCRRRLAETLNMPAKNLTMVPQPQLSFYDAEVVQKRCVAPDGNCQFRSVSYALLGTEEAHIELRRQVAQYLKDNFSRLSWLINPDRLQEEDWRMAKLDKKYKVRVPYKGSRKYPVVDADELKRNWVIRLGDVRYRIWGDECTLAVIAEMYNICIVVEQQEQDGRRATQMGSHAIEVIRPYDVSSDYRLPTIFLIFEIRQQHYNVVERVKRR
ncbi:hypothetical protein NCLIV_012110 [Neospora caninum Liverpool]|uniref:OTU family cysteine protease n=1 Tax=Neospora caninum (strain Liverpool) TaxID=572307 RepID=F0V9Y2_NEOCL|nr:hypothetical protein NCLIV_012110 [Neospora caninum Liverpool]CBZ50744.1 hypothetical protein NCLIV_012110 [Neospora caninum Liverpool]CEL65358.1 TPA: OTU family cysteine protease [Neospora caninum Liverpool]|eukprot:XP_003880777.1 hypothetical protein NCLIV_012110 [Neospora caninum Liverpool]